VGAKASGEGAERQLGPVLPMAQQKCAMALAAVLCLLSARPAANEGLPDVLAKVAADICVDARDVDSGPPKRTAARR
jgi:hypothetical protein